MRGADFEALADKLREAYCGKDLLITWDDASPSVKEDWLRAADVAYSIIETTVANARPPEKTSKMRQALWNIIEEAQIALKAD